MDVKIKNKIIKFIRKHHVLTLATSNDNLPYCASCFYAFLEEENMLVFTSDIETKHMKEALEQNIVAGTIALETRIVGKIRGIQFRGTLREAGDELGKKARKAYLRRFPFAFLRDTKLWLIQLTFVKFTDNRLGFGKKLVWGKL